MTGKPRECVLLEAGTGRAPPRHAHGDLTSLAPHERLPDERIVESFASTRDEA